VEQRERLLHSANARSTKVLIGAIQIAATLDQCAVSLNHRVPLTFTLEMAEATDAWSTHT
jgi:hypothetical protein